jgi:hypothetical protein
LATSSCLRNSELEPWSSDAFPMTLNLGPVSSPWRPNCRHVTRTFNQSAPPLANHVVQTIRAVGGVSCLGPLVGCGPDAGNDGCIWRVEST